VLPRREEETERTFSDKTKGGNPPPSPSPPRSLPVSLGFKVGPSLKGEMDRFGGPLVLVLVLAILGIDAVPGRLNGKLRFIP